MDEARKGELSGDSESIEPARGMKTPLTNETERGFEPGAGMKPAGAERHGRKPVRVSCRVTANQSNRHVE